MTPITIAIDPVLARLRELLEGAYGDRLARVVLFGSRARGENRKDSDYDVAIFLRDLEDRDTEIDRMAEIQSLLLDETDAFVHTMAFHCDAWTERTPLMHEIRSEGVDV